MLNFIAAESLSRGERAASGGAGRGGRRRSRQPEAASGRQHCRARLDAGQRACAEDPAGGEPRQRPLVVLQGDGAPPRLPPHRRRGRRFSTEQSSVYSSHVGRVWRRCRSERRRSRAARLGKAAAGPARRAGATRRWTRRWRRRSSLDVGADRDGAWKADRAAPRRAAHADAALEEGGRPALDYLIEARAGRRGQFEVVLPRTGQSRPAALLRNLAPDTWYEFRVAAILDDDAAAIGPKSEASAAVKTRPYDAGRASSAPPRGADASPFAHLTTSPPNSGRGPAGGSPFHHLTVSPPQTPGRGRSRSPGRRPRRHHHDSAQLDRLRSAPPSSRRVDDGSALAAAEAAAAATLAAEEQRARRRRRRPRRRRRSASRRRRWRRRRTEGRRTRGASNSPRRRRWRRRGAAETGDQAERERVANYLVMCATKAAGEGAQVLDATVAGLGNVQLDRALRAFMGADVEKSGDIDVWEFGRALASLAAEIPTAAPRGRRATPSPKSTSTRRAASTGASS